MTTSPDSPAFPISLLRAKCSGSIAALQKMDKPHHAAILRGEFGDDYNRLLLCCGSQFPQMAGLLPPKAAIEAYGDGDTDMRVVTTPAELLTYYLQLFEMLGCMSAEQQ